MGRDHRHLDTPGRRWDVALDARPVGRPPEVGEVFQRFACGAAFAASLARA